MSFMYFTIKQMDYCKETDLNHTDIEAFSLCVFFGR